nr:hypothetical protein [Tanacetum cinerariifolium]
MTLEAYNNHHNLGINIKIYGKNQRTKKRRISPNKMQSAQMKVQRLSSDILSTLPENVIDDILTRMPIRDAVRTSILSRKWRFCWTSIPKLVFDDKLVIVPSKCKQLKKYKLASAIFHVLLRHTGSILEFSIDGGELEIQLTLQAAVFVLFIAKIKSSKAYYCVSDTGFGIRLKYLAVGGMSQQLPTSFANLENLLLALRLTDQDEISSALCLIRNSPNLERLTLRFEKSDGPQVSMNSLDLQDYSAFNFDYLEKLEMLNYSNLDLELEFVKLVMAKSPVLEKVRIELNDEVSVDEELDILRDFVRLPFPRASPSAITIIEHRKAFP